MRLSNYEHSGKLNGVTRMHSLPVKPHVHFPRPLFGLLVLACVTVSFTLGWLFGHQQGVRSVVPEGEGRVLGQGEIAPYLSEDVEFGLFWDTWNLLKEKFYRQPVSDKELFYGAMEGLLSSTGDPYTSFFNPEEAEEFNMDLAGQFEGIGAEIGIKDNQLQIVAPLPGSPAEQAGILPGDNIYLIDGEDTTGIAVEEAVSKIRGEKGTTVVLTIGRNGFGELMDIPIERDTITIDSVKFTMRDDRIAVIDLYFFNEDTTVLFVAAVNELLASGARGIILDLRSNPGGLLTSAIDVASAWTGPEPVVIQRMQGKDETLDGFGSTRLNEIPTVVLVNGGSASGSEIVAGALQDYGLATLIGTQTFGKGSVQDYQDLEDGSAVKITVAEWLTPNGRSINGEGILPDITVEVTPEDLLAERDPQFEKAIEVLSSQLSF
jgi:carboxyl-terminal processing protease